MEETVEVKQRHPGLSFARQWSSRSKSKSSQKSLSRVVENGAYNGFVDRINDLDEEDLEEMTSRIASGLRS